MGIGMILFSMLIAGLVAYRWGQTRPDHLTTWQIRNDAVREALAEFNGPWEYASSLGVVDTALKRDKGHTRLILTGRRPEGVQPGATVMLEMGSSTPYDSIVVYKMKIGQILNPRWTKQERPFKRAA